MTVTAVDKNVIPGLQGKLPQRFTVSLSLRSGNFEVVANQCGPLQTVVNAPLAARLSGLLDHRRIDQSQRWNERRFSDKAAFLKQRATKPIQPILAFAQPFEQGYVGKFRKLGLPGPHHGLSHRKTAPQVQQKRAHVVLFTLILTQPFQRLRHLPQLFPVRREKGKQQFPILVREPLRRYLIS
jgi:hypothetical protein